MQDPLSVASAANPSKQSPQAAQTTKISFNDEPAVASQATHEPLREALDYTLTVGQAQQRFADLKRHVPKDRTVQNYCLQGDIAAQKIRTTFGMEWIINPQSLDAFILREPEMPSVASDASRDHDSRPTGEKRNLVDVLIQNARLLAQVEDRDEMISELKQERSFMQDQVRSAVHLSERALAQGDTLLKTIQVMRIGPGSSDARETPEN